MRPRWLRREEQVRVNHVAKAAKAPGKCQACGQPIPIGTPYKWVKGRYTSKQVRHETCPAWKKSELAGGHVAELYAAQEDIEAAVAGSPLPDEPPEGDEAWAEAVGAVEAVLAAVEAARELAEDVAGRYDEAAEPFSGGGPSGEKRDMTESWRDELEDAESTLQAAVDQMESAEGDDREGALDEARAAIEEAETASSSLEL